MSIDTKRKTKNNNAMKVNEAPKKIYFSSNENGTHYYTEGIPSEREYVEYVHKDAFIEKACTWLKDRAERFVVNTPVCDYYDYKQAVEDFKDYMKGE